MAKIFSKINWSLVAIISVVLDYTFKIIPLPNMMEIVEKETTYITICAVFEGFILSFLGILLGLSSNIVVKRLINTTEVDNNINYLFTSLKFFMIANVVSIIYIIGLVNLINERYLNYINRIIYSTGLVTFLIGIILFLYFCHFFSVVIQTIYYKEKNKEIIENAKIVVERVKNEKK